MSEFDLKQLMRTLPQVGRVSWIGLRPERRKPLNIVEAVQADIDQGLIGDRYNGAKGSDRQVTLIQEEHLSVLAALLSRDELPPELLRRNILVSGINLLALKGKKFQIGDAVLEGTGNCQPCSLMEYQLGPGGYNAMRGHGGITATVIESGTIRVGDGVCSLPDKP